METERRTDGPPRKRWATRLVATGLVAGGAAAGIIGVTAAATAATPSPSASSSVSASAGTDAETNDGKTGQRSDETVVTGSKAATLKAAALKAVPGGTVERIETDADGAAFEAHMTKSDGTRVTVKFDSSLKTTGVEEGMGKGGGHDGRGGNDHDADDTAS